MVVFHFFFFLSHWLESRTEDEIRSIIINHKLEAITEKSGTASKESSSPKSQRHHIRSGPFALTLLHEVDTQSYLVEATIILAFVRAVKLVSQLKQTRDQTWKDRN